MTKLGIFVGENGKWSFFQDIYEDLSRHYQMDVFQEKVYRTPIFQGRLNRWGHQQAIKTRLQRNDACFFEWASELLVPATHMPVQCPIITRLHSYEITFWAPKINWDHVDKVILLSQSMRDKFSQFYPAHAHKAEVVYNGVALDKFHPPAQRDFTFNIGMLCSIHPVKRVYEMVLVIHSLKQAGYNPHLHIAGGKWSDGYFDDYYLSIERTIEKLDLHQNVTLHGHVTETAKWLQQIDIFISNSYWEGQQVALLEAMASGCFCLVHFWDGAEECVPAENLYVTDIELQEKLISYAELADQEKRQQQALMRTIACEKFDAEQQKANIRRVIEDVLTSSPSAANYAIPLPDAG